MNAISVKKLDLNTAGSFFNCGAWTDTSKKYIYLIGRENNAANPAPVPDVSELSLYKLDKDLKIVTKKTVWKPKYDSFFLEDPRVIEIDKKLIIGLTTVLRNRSSFNTFASFIEVEDKDNWPEKFPNVTLMEGLGEGKNVTPIDDRLLIFRPSEEEYFHKLAIIDYRNDQNVARHVGDVSLPDNLSWGKWKMGTTIPPIWMNKNEALFLVQGITIINNKYVYGMGRGKLTRNGDKFKAEIDSEPLLTPDLMKTMINEEVTERFPYRKVLYCCGGIVKKDEPSVLYLYINVGDFKTFEVGYPLSELYK